MLTNKQTVHRILWEERENQQGGRAGATRPRNIIVEDSHETS
jgi:hypothetical protein